MIGSDRVTDHVLYERRGDIAILTVDRPEKRNALNMEIVVGLGQFFASPPEGLAAVVLTSSGQHFSAGLDLSELQETSVFEGVLHSRSWHEPFTRIETGPLPVISVLRGAVIGGGLELALTTHIRVAEQSAYYALPEGGRGIFVGGGASVRLPRIIGVPRMADMMLTGRVLSAADGQQLGISQYLVDDGDGLDKAIELATKIATNAPFTNYAIIQALPRISEMAPGEGLFVESLVAAIAQGTDEAKANLRAFLEGRAAKVDGGQANGSRS
jgi:enoyl-CoA hydratase/carnithine racemase